MMSRKRSSGPYSYDDDEDYVPTKGVKYSEREDLIPQKEKKHSLDSDEEEDNEDEDDETGGKNYDVLRDEDIDGQEDGTVDFEGETQITPFNMKEEMEDGHFDGDGFYHFKKDADVIKDAWLDDIDWVKVKHREGDEKKYGSDIDSDADNDDEIDREAADGIIAIYTEILAFLKPGETVAKALKRLGGNKKISSSQRWKLKKTGNLGSENGDNNMSDILKLTELANKIVTTGNMDVYQETFEMITLKVERSKAPAPKPAMDMFADEEHKNKDVKCEDKLEGSLQGQQVHDSVAKITWELRWEDKDDAEIHGPFSNEKMLQWQESGYFKNGAYVRKTCEQGQSWYSTRRIDFDLYT
ncbi:CD2 antigen cytoplasmic tail-binding protein 2 homolog [Procambarus clarkii]|uniref:CD2 antigen cytoplasmic tail-binding protein 2 homolog n=1 Tax=Procambarus clarkii TaxID=6728 RepID=UPI00374341C7